MTEDEMFQAFISMRAAMNDAFGEQRSENAKTLTNALDAAVEEMREQTQASNDRLRGDMMARFDRVEDRLTSMAEDITVTMMAVQVEDKRRVSDRSEPLAMSELLTAMQRQTTRLRTDVDQLNAARPPAE